jgi:hypothetical protein
MVVKKAEKTRTHFIFRIEHLAALGTLRLAAFPSASALGSTDSAAGCPALFVGFPATIADRCIIDGEAIACDENVSQALSCVQPKAPRQLEFGFEHSEEIVRCRRNHAEYDFPRPFIIGYGSSPSRCGPERALQTIKR